MKVFASEDHRLHAPSGEVYDGKLVTPFERPDRWDHIATALDATSWAERHTPEDLDPACLTRVHDQRYLDFLTTAWSQWQDAGHSGDMIPTCFPARRLVQREPIDIDGRLGYFAFAAETAITATTLPAALSSAAAARSGQRAVTAGDVVAFALCRPPGHHAGRDTFGGYCFINNAAVAAQGFLDDGAERVAMLDIDFHHGNGTQDIFYDRDDVLYVSLHGDPRHEFPHFAGYADEVGHGAGTGWNVNFPLPPGTDGPSWFEALAQAHQHIADAHVDALVVSLGVDTFDGDPISSFTLTTADFTTIGRQLAGLGLPTLYCMEGGYAVAEIGRNTVNVLAGHREGLR